MPGDLDADYDVLYDGGCRLCSRTVVWLRRLDWRRRLRYHDVHGEWEALSRAYPTLDGYACAEALHVIDRAGRVTVGFDGFRSLAWTVPAFWPLVPFLYLPGAAVIGRRMYTLVAARRSSICAVPGARSRRAAGPRRA